MTGVGDYTKRRNAGFVLFDIAAAVFLVAVGIAGTTQIYFVGLSTLQVSQEKTIALRAIENELESLRALPMAELAPTQDSGFVSETPELERLVRVAESVSIRDASHDGAVLREVTVSLSWNSLAGRRITKSMTTLMGDI